MLRSLFESIVEVAERQTWLDPFAETLQSAIGSVTSAAGPAGQNVRNLLYGVWLGHPLHPVLTDVPLGAWTAGVALDIVDGVSGQDRMAPAADLVTAVGVAGAVGSAVTGLSDWQWAYGRGQRVGLVHGLLNLSSTMIYVLSLILRLRGARSAGRVTGFTGYIIALVAAYLGGDLVFRERLGVDKSAGQMIPPEFQPVLAESELPEGAMKRVEVEGINVLLARCRNRVFAISEICSHEGGPLAEGKLEDCTVICPWHGSQFALESGEVINGPATYAQPRYEVRVRDGQIEVRGTPQG